jgi:hypothetical protein
MRYDEILYINECVREGFCSNSLIVGANIQNRHFFIDIID